MFARSIAILGALALFVGLAPGNAEAGGRKGCCQPKVCYQKVMSPPVYKTVMVKVMVQPQRCTLQHIPAVYQTRQEQVVVQPARQVVHTKPAVYGKVAVTEVVRAGYTKWKKKRGRCGNCTTHAVHVPAKYKTRCKKVVVQPASQWVETRPAVHGVVNRQVMVRPASTTRVCQPPVYQMVPRQVLVSPGTAHMVPVAHGGGRCGSRCGSRCGGW